MTATLVEQFAEYLDFLRECENEPPTTEPRLLNLPDIRQRDFFSCGAAASMSVGGFFGVGPETLEEWKTALGTNADDGTPPDRIIGYLRSLGLQVDARDSMTVDDLREAWLAGKPTICCVQDYIDPGPSNGWDSGHYLTVIGVALGHLFCQDSSQDNLVEGSGTIADQGRVLICEDVWLRNWHDEDAAGKKFDRYGISVGPSAVAESRRGAFVQECGGEGGKPGPCPEGGADTPASKTKASKTDKKTASKTNKKEKEVAAKTSSETPTADTATSKPRLPEPTPSETAKRAKAAHVMVDREIQRYAEEHNESFVAKALGGTSLPDTEPMDVAIARNPQDQAKWDAEAARWHADKAAGKRPPAKMDTTGDMAHMVEMKTSVVGANGMIDMNKYAMVRKIVAEKERKATLHTVVFDDKKVFNANGPGQHDESKRRIFYRRGAAGTRPIEDLHECKDMEEVSRLMNMPEKNLPAAAQRSDGALRFGRWKAGEDEKGKYFTNNKTGDVARVKK